jgi:hypothetical protein
MRWLIVGLLVNSATVFGQDSVIIGVAGDSVSTGAVAHPGLSFDADLIWNRLRGSEMPGSLLNEDWTLAAKGAKVRRLAPLAFEFGGASDWVGRNFLHTVMSRYFDFPELSYSAFLGSNPDQEPKTILNAAQDGARIAALKAQILRIYAANNQQLPPQLIIFFTGNDICGPTLGAMTTAEDFGDHLRSGLELIARLNTARTRVLVLSHLSIQQIVQSPSILAKQVPAHSKVMTCGELQKQRAIAWNTSTKDLGYDVSQLLSLVSMPSTPQMFCPNLFGSNLDFAGKDQIFTVTGRIRAYRQQAQRIVEDLQRTQNPEATTRVDFGFVPETETIRFEADDIANDCFHLSPNGQLKISAVVKPLLQQ